MPTTDKAKRRAGLLASQRRWKAKPENHIKFRAHARVNYAKKHRPDLLRKAESCEICDVNPKRLHGHHEDHAAWWDCLWVCGRCHGKHHRGVLDFPDRALPDPIAFRAYAPPSESRDEAAESDEYRRVLRSLEVVDDRRAAMLRMRMNECTLRQIGEAFGFTREYARQELVGAVAELKWLLRRGDA